jgi:hypothetical protein
MRFHQLFVIVSLFAVFAAGCSSGSSGGGAQPPTNNNGGDDPIVPPVTPPEEPGEDPVTPPEEPGEEPVTPPEEPGEEPVTPPEEPVTPPVTGRETYGSFEGAVEALDSWPNLDDIQKNIFGAQQATPEGNVRVRVVYPTTANIWVERRGLAGVPIQGAPIGNGPDYYTDLFVPVGMPVLVGTDSGYYFDMTPESAGDKLPVTTGFSEHMHWDYTQSVTEGDVANLRTANYGVFTPDAESMVVYPEGYVVDRLPAFYLYVTATAPVAADG